MKIYEMTATFGKLQHEKLTLKPGLNILEAPNEWGKSTWCAFLAAMFYGVDTRAKTTKNTLADKEHYAPWSGQTMSGRIRLQWQGKDITIERSTKGRVPMGEFRAYETETGLNVPQLTAENCGEMLLGAEESVFRRAGFIRLADLPVTRDDALRNRLNALVTTGDESGDGERLARELKNLKNKCRYNRSGLLPQAEEERNGIRKDLEELLNLQHQSEQLCSQAEQEEKNLRDLQNHMTHLGNQQAGEDAVRVRQAQLERDRAKARYEQRKAICDRLPSPEKNEEKRKKIQELAGRQEEILARQKLPGQELPPEIPEVFRSMTPPEAAAMAARDQRLFTFLQTDFMPVWLLMALCAFAGTVLLCALEKIFWAVACMALGGLLCAWAFLYKKLREKYLEILPEKYGDPDPEHWTASAGVYLNAGASGPDRNAAAAQLMDLKSQQRLLCGNLSVGDALEALRKVDGQWEHLTQEKKELQQAEEHLEDVTAMARTSRKPDAEDRLICPEEETRHRIAACRQHHQELLSRIGQYQGRMETLGTEPQLRQSLEAAEQRIQKLETFYEALTIALAKLEEASAELQRRFAPRIVSRAQELLGRMTGGRYEKLAMEEDFSLNAAAEEETVLRNALYRSEGTMDQLYLSLRLAVSEVLMPEAPLVLDDALVRFDGKRLAETLEILKEEEKQVLLFTCQEREGKLQPDALIRKG